MIGQLVGTYKILEKLSEGGMGAVYKAVDTMLDREVAIKVLRPELASQTTVVERFRLEAITLAKLNHPNIATLHSFFGQGGELFMILEYVSGETLDKVLQRRGPLSCEEAIPLFSELLNCIAHAHEFGVIHRDIKPANLMLTEKGTLKVLDFGIARLRGSARITRSGNIIGTLEYMSPEQTKGMETDARSDIYSLGMTLYEILTGKTPFDSENEFELIQKQIGEMPPAPRIINPDIPEEIEAAIIKSYAKNPEERFQTAGEFRETLLKAGFASSAAYATAGAAESFSRNLGTHPLQFGVSKPSVSKDTFQGIVIDSPETPTVEIVKDNQSELSSGTNSSNRVDNRIKEIPFNQNQFSPNVAFETADKSPSQTSFLSKLGGLNYLLAGAGVFILLILLIGLPFISFKPEENPPKIENKESVQKGSEPEGQKPDILTVSDGDDDSANRSPNLQLQTPTVQPATDAQPAQTTTTTAAPSQMTAKKKKTRGSEAERLRRAEKLLTGK